MKIVINEKKEFQDTEIIINCRQLDEELIKIISSLKSLEEKVTGSLNGKIFVIDTLEIYYFESVDKKTFIYTEKEVYETHLRLYEIEERFKNSHFFRASKSTIINLSKIKIITPLFGGKVEAILENDEKLFVSRQYVKILKNKLDF